MAITFQEELIENLVEELKPLLQEHWKELANHQDDRPLDPDFDAYILINRRQVIRFITVRDNEKLIGYASFLISNHLHYRSWKYAVSDVYYLSLEYRKTNVGVQFFQNIETWLKDIGVNSITVQDKVNHAHTSFFERLGFTHVEQVYEKVI